MTSQMNKSKCTSRELRRLGLKGPAPLYHPGSPSFPGLAHDFHILLPPARMFFPNSTQVHDQPLRKVHPNSPCLGSSSLAHHKAGCCFETASCSPAWPHTHLLGEDDVELWILLHPQTKFWDYRYVPLCSVMHCWRASLGLHRCQATMLPTELHH